MDELNRKNNEDLLAYIKRLTLSKRSLDLDYQEWGDKILGEDNTYSSENLRKAFYVLEKIFKNTNQEQLKVLESKENESKLLNEVKDIIGELDIKKQEIRNKTNELNRIKRGFIKTIEISNDLKETIHGEINNIPQFNFKPILSTSNNKLIVSVADWHVGYVIKDYLGNSYCYEIAKKRLALLISEITKTCNIYDIKDVIVVNQGDIIENAYMRQNQGYECEFNLSQQIVKATQLMFGFISEISKIGNVEFYSLGGNHSRLSSKDANIESDNVNVIITEMIRDFVNLSGNERIVIGEVDYKDDSCVFEVNGFKCKAIHGDNRISDPKKMFDAEATLDKEYYSIIFKGHNHNFNVSSQNGGYVITTGCLFAFNPYSVKKMSCSTNASQTMVVVSDKIEFIKDVNLQII